MQDTQIWVWIIVAAALLAILGLGLYSFFMNKKIQKDRDKLFEESEEIRESTQDNDETNETVHVLDNADVTHSSTPENGLDQESVKKKKSSNSTRSKKSK